MRPKSLPFLSIFLFILPHGPDKLSLLRTIKRFVLTFINRVGTIQVSKEVGGVRKCQFLQIYSTIYADVGGWVA